MPSVLIVEPLTFSDSIDSTTKIGLLEDVINFHETLDSHRYPSIFYDRISWNDNILVDSGRLINVSFEDTFTFNEDMTRRQPQYIDEFLFIFDWIELPNGLLYETVIFSEDISGNASRTFRDLMTFTETLTYTGDFVHDAEDEITFSDWMHLYINDPWRPMVPIVEESP